jgi:hypothetical protein
MGAFLQGCVLACDLNHKGDSCYESCGMPSMCTYEGNG